MPLKIGDKAPNFALKNVRGDTVRLSDYAGKNYVVLIFYPGDETVGMHEAALRGEGRLRAFPSKAGEGFRH